MSHFTVMVIGEDASQQLARFDERIIVDEYIVGAVSEEEKQRMLDYYTKLDMFEGSFEECYEKHGRYWNGNGWRKDSTGEWQEFSTYNPDSKWDWYSLGGRWSGAFIILKDGCHGAIGESGAFDNEVGVDSARKCDIDFDAIKERGRETFIPFAVLYNDEWIEKGSMGWFGVHTDTYTDEEWEDIVWNIVEGLPDETLISFYDCHI